MILITASGKKGAAPRALAREVDAVIGTGEISAAAITAIRSGQVAANKVIYQAPRGSEVNVQLSLEDDPIGGWSVSLLVNADPRTR